MIFNLMNETVRHGVRYLFVAFFVVLAIASTAVTVCAQPTAESGSSSQAENAVTMDRAKMLEEGMALIEEGEKMVEEGNRLLSNPGHKPGKAGKMLKKNMGELMIEQGKEKIEQGNLLIEQSRM